MQSLLDCWDIDLIMVSLMMMTYVTIIQWTRVPQTDMQPGGILSQDNPLNISFSFNTDGVAPYKSSNKQNFWPIFLVINELPPRLR